MKDRLYLVLGVLLVAAVVGLVCWSPWELREPVYAGKPVSFWLTHTNSMGWTPVLDSDAIPFLIKALRRDSWFGAAVYRKRMWPRLPAAIKSHLPPPANPVFRDRAASLLYWMGPTAEPAVPALIRALEQDDYYVVRNQAAAALGSIGKGDSNVVTALVGALRDKPVRSAAISALRQIGQGTNAAVAALTEASKGNGRRVRLPADSKLGAIGYRNETAVAALTEALKHKDRYVRIFAAFALCDIGAGTGGSTVVTVLTEALKDAEAEVRRRAAGCLGQIGKGNKAVVVGLTEAINDTNLLVHLEAAKSLLKLAPKAAAKAKLRTPSP